MPRRRGPRLPENLPVVEEVLEPEPVKAAAEQWRKIGEEVSEQIDFKPGGFFQSKEESPRLAGIILRQIGKLYAIEAALREERAGPEERRRQRRARSRPLPTLTPAAWAKASHPQLKAA